ncbi:PQQ-dependent sugar dehydrogenase [Halorussus sp. MSC15.2]|uniref:PQQ-dependent sugar dehydrogenase n=1 Tax=Halorussus sp. MSC15.2 TaxID=2283638 RepID=UPI0013CFD1EF|nr:PQQ-dependent sugar dehydrogenase [Halorussus sp. MSC15.2]NEU58622.1 PQQ-dependent sugar dehydrogenase [Halorussus sp. MSC15.2]
MATDESNSESGPISSQSPEIGLRKVAEGSFAPTDFAVAPGETTRKYVLDQPGVVRVLKDGDLRDEPFLDIRDRVVELYYGHDERGLLGIAFHPDYDQNRKFYVRYSAPPQERTPEGWNHTGMLSEFRATENGERADAESERLVMRMPHPGAHHNAGQIAFGPDGYLYVGMGDGGNTGDTGKGHVEGGNGQDITESGMGSIMRIDVDGQEGTNPYAIPDDNPLVGEDGIDELYAWGLRNPWRLSFDSEGRLFVADVGEHLFEWVNLVEKGKNYGWNVKEGSHCFDPENQWRPADDCPDVNDRGEELVDPIVEYPHIEGVTEVGAFVGSAVTGGYVYEGDDLPELQGSYVFGDLSKKYDAPRARLFAATASDDGSDRWELQSVDIEGLEANVLDGYLFTLGRDHDGELYVLTSRTLNTQKKREGTIYKVVPPEESEVSSLRYDWFDATNDAYWYSLFNMNSIFQMSGNGIRFPLHEAQFDSLPQKMKARMKGMMQRAMLAKRKRGILKNTPRADELPTKNPHINVAPFTTGDPHFQKEPKIPLRIRNRGRYRPDASTTQWDTDQSSQVISPASLGWTHLKGVTWAKSFEHEFNLAPVASKDRPQFLGTATQMGIKYALQNGHLRKNPDDEDDMRLVGTYRPATDEVVDETASPEDYAAMLWFLSDMASYAENGWYGYENPSPLIEVGEIRRLTDRMADATFEEYPPERILDAGTARDLGVMLGATGWYGTHAGNAEMETKASDYANDLADVVESNLAGDGRVETDSSHQAATQGVVGQGLLWASQIDGVGRSDAAESALSYLLEELWDEAAGTFATERGATTYTVTPRHAGDITGGLNAADAVLGLDGVKQKFATHFNNTFNRGRLQRSTRWQAYRPEGEYPLPLSPDAEGEYGQAAVYNAEVEYDTETDKWRVTDDSFDTAGALYLSNQDLWISIWGGEEFPGRGVPGRTDRLERWEQTRVEGYTPPQSE